MRICFRRKQKRPQVERKLRDMGLEWFDLGNVTPERRKVLRSILSRMTESTVPPA